MSPAEQRNPLISGIIQNSNSALPAFQRTPLLTVIALNASHLHQRELQEQGVSHARKLAHIRLQHRQNLFAFFRQSLRRLQRSHAGAIPAPKFEI